MRPQCTPTGPSGCVNYRIDVVLNGRGRLQRRCYWLLDADEDIVLVHYLSARQLTGGPRARGGHTRTVASQDTTSVEVNHQQQQSPSERRKWHRI